MFSTLVKYQPERSGAFLGSPSIVRLEEGAIIASFDYFGTGIRNRENECGLTTICRSDDNGNSWQEVTHFMGAFWGTLFLHRGALYHLCCDREYGSIVIRKSMDGGYSWTNPIDEKSGLLFPAGKGHTNPNYHTAPTPVVFHKGRIFHAFEDLFINGDQPEWRPGRFKAFAISAPEEEDLLLASSWKATNKVTFEQELAGEKIANCDGHGWLEGNMVIGPDGTLRNIMRVHTLTPNRAAILTVSDDGSKMQFDYGNGFIDFVGGASKFVIRRDPVTGKYIMLSNPIAFDPNDPQRVLSLRNVLSLSTSTDLKNWKKCKDILTDDSGLSPDLSCQLTGFQYPDWQFDGNDLIMLVRTAFRGARNYHDSNRIVFHILKDFRKYL